MMMVPYKTIAGTRNITAFLYNNLILKESFQAFFSPPIVLPMRAALWLLVRVSMGPELSELRVASGLATVAVDLSPASPVQRSVNCNVGP